MARRFVGDPHASALDPFLDRIGIGEVLDAVDHVLGDAASRRPA
ncbi:MAG: hypothetical protein ACRD0P_31645 [Stackebrandtia sp.]